MNLTQDDLQAIQQIIQTTVQATVQPMIDELDDALSRQTAEGFVNIDKRFDVIVTNLGRIENKLNPTIEQVEDHELRLKALVPKAV